MKRLLNFTLIFLFLISCLTLTGCELLTNVFNGITGGDNQNVHVNSYEPITGKFYLYKAIDQRINCADTYFDIDGSEGNFTLKYYENGVLKKEGIFQKIVANPEKIGYFTDNLHFNIKCGDSYEHVSAYTELFDPINQFRIIDEYSGGKTEIKYYYSQLPFVLGTYLREGATYVEESPNKNNVDYTKPTLANYTAELNGVFQLDENHYFYFINPHGYTIKNGDYLDSYFQYYSPELDKPLEGFAHGVTYENSIAPPRIFFSYSQKSTYYEILEDTENALTFGYTTFTSNDTMVDHYGSIDFSNGKLNSFSFEHLSRNWTEEEWDEYTKNADAKLPDAIIYEYVGGTYVKK